MGIDLSKLYVEDRDDKPFIANENGFPFPWTIADLDRIVLALKSESIMKRRGWSVFKEISGWSVSDNKGFIRGMGCQDPFSAVVEAEEWYREHIERVEE